MSDLEKLFEHAPEGATAIGQRGNDLAFTNGDSDVYLDGHWGISIGWQTIATRPQPEQKTVEDAVEHYGESFIAGEWTHIRSDETGKMFFATGEVDSENWRDSYLVCTREEFEACVAAKTESEPHFKATRENLDKIAKDAKGDFVEVEQEGEKWTHIIDDDEGPLTRCRKHLKLGNGNNWVYVCEKGEYFVPGKMDYFGVKPIKPTITKSDFADFVIEKLSDGTHQDAVCYLLQQKLDQHEVIEGPAND